LHNNYNSKAELHEDAAQFRRPFRLASLSDSWNIWGNKKWPLLIRFLDPAPSVSSLPLPGIEHQLEVAISCRISLPVTPAGDWVRHLAPAS